VNSGPVIVFGMTLFVGCGGSVNSVADAGGGADGAAAADASSAIVPVDAGSHDSGDVETDSANDGCPAASEIPTADVYMCSPLSAGSTGCPSQTGDPSAIYPAGCVMLLPYAGACVRPCCGPVSCTCQQMSGTTTFAFACPL
jgi:hypothetical protein